MTGVTQRAAGTGSVVLNANGTITYLLPDGSFTGTATFAYTVTDPSGKTSTATVTVIVAPKQGK